MARSTVYLLSSAFFIILIAAGSYFYKAHLKKSKTFVARAGQYTITEDQVQYQMAVNSYMIPQPTDRALALKQLKEMYEYQSIMNEFNYHILPPQIEREGRRIKSATKNPEIIKKIKSISGFDSSYYNEIFLKGVLIKRLIFNEFFFTQDSIHLPTKQMAQQVAASLKGLKPAQLLKTIRDRELLAFEVVIDTKGLEQKQVSPIIKEGPAVNPPTPIDSLEQKKSAANGWIRDHSKYENFSGAFIFDQREHWEIFFPERWDPKSATIKGIFVVVRKQPFQDWIKDKVGIEPPRNEI